MDNEKYGKKILNGLENDVSSMLESFGEFLKRKMNAYQKIDFAHEFLTMVTFKLRQSKCSLDKDQLAGFLFDTIKATDEEFEYDPKFIAIQFKALITYYKKKKDYENAIKVLEYLIQKGITDEDSEKFHVQLDEMFRKQIKYARKLKRAAAKGAE